MRTFGEQSMLRFGDHFAPTPLGTALPCDIATGRRKWKIAHHGT
jgi:hypothetical protein